MSLKTMTRIWDHSNQTSSDLLLLLAIADHADDDGICWPGIPVLASKTRSLPRQVKRNITKLAARGELIIQRNRGRSHTNLYFILVGFGLAEIAGILQTRFELSEREAHRLAEDALKLQNDYKNSVTGDTIKTQKKVSSRVIKGVIQGKKVSSRVIKGVTGDTRTVIEPSFKPSEPGAAKLRRAPVSLGYKIFVEETQRHCLNKAQIKQIERVVGADPPALETWRETVRAWSLAGNKLTNATGMLDWFQSGKRSNYEPRGLKANGHNQPTEISTGEEQARYKRMRAAIDAAAHDAGGISEGQ